MRSARAHALARAGSSAPRRVQVARARRAAVARARAQELSWRNGSVWRRRSKARRIVADARTPKSVDAVDATTSMTRDADVEGIAASDLELVEVG